VAEGRDRASAAPAATPAQLRADAGQLQAELAALRATLPAAEDGVDPVLSVLAADVFEPVYERWLRVDTAGLEHVPAEGPALLAGGGSGLLPVEGAVLKLAVLRRSPARRALRVLVPTWLVSLPIVGPLLQATGEAAEDPGQALELLARGELVAVPGLSEAEAAAIAHEARVPLLPVVVSAPRVPLLGALLLPGWRVEVLEPVRADVVRPA
jgi:hypothetical protein